MWNGKRPDRQSSTTSLEKALEICEALSARPEGMSVSELARQVPLPGPTVHRLLRVLKTRGYVQQDEMTKRYRLTLKMLDLSFRVLDRSELRLHAYPVLRDFVLRTNARAFLAMLADGEVTYVWNAGPDEVAMHTTYGKPMPGHCSLYFSPESVRRLSCLRLERAPGTADIVRLGPPAVSRSGQRLACTCAPVYDYTAREVARVGVFAHDVPDEELAGSRGPDASELARLISLRLGAIPQPAFSMGERRRG
jgi:DNA-binding MarR family transcriptional regulator